MIPSLGAERVFSKTGANSEDDLPRLSTRALAHEGLRISNLGPAELAHEMKQK